GLVGARARELAPAILADNPHLHPDRDGPGLRRYVEGLARCERAYSWLAERDDPVFADVDAGVVHGVYERLLTWERACDQAEERLCISPAARARLGLDRMRAAALTADQLAQLRERGAEIEQERTGTGITAKSRSKKRTQARALRGGESGK